MYPYGSASAERDDAIAVLGALKVTTATHIMRLVRPHLRDNKSVRNSGAAEAGLGGCVARTCGSAPIFRWQDGGWSCGCGCGFGVSHARTPHARGGRSSSRSRA